MVHPLVSEPSVIHAQNVDGSLLKYEPSAISVPSVEGSAFGVEPSVICVFIADGWLCLHRTVHDIGL